MKYYLVTCATPFVGEENDYYVAVESKEDLDAFVLDVIYENANEWYDLQTLDENDMTEDEYYAGCHARRVEEITEEEYYDACPWERP